MNTRQNPVAELVRPVRMPLLLQRLIILGALTIAAQAPTRAGAATRPLTLDDYYRLQSVSEAEISPDGRWVAYTLSTPNRRTDRDASDIWMVRYDGSEQLQLTHSEVDEHSPHFSPDGSTLAFMRDPADSKATAQIWLMNLRGGEARQLSHFEGTISSFAMAPDGKRLVFAGQEPLHAGPEPEQPLPVVVDRLQFREDGESFLGVERTHLYLLDLASGRSSALTSGAYNEMQPAWSPDSSQIVFLSKRDVDLDATQ